MSSNNKFHYGLPSAGDDHEEKPSHSVSGVFILLLLVFYILLAFVVTVLKNEMPAVIKEKDIPKDDWKTFSEESATKYLYRIVGDQARVAGTVHHFVKTRDLKWLLEEVTSNSFNPVHIDWQYVSGNYWLAFKTPHVNSYNNVSNIIAVLEGESGVTSNSIGTSLLVNCHFDSVPYGQGASDNGVFCASMVEILAKLSRRKQKFRHNIVFLFNGAEENVLLGSHGFLSHPWSKNVIGVVNLDSAGMNGRPSVFQVTDPRFLSSYRASRPTAQGLGQMLFTSGMIPSDTDFRVFRDFGNMTGMDLAFTDWGHVYHTRNDRPDLIQNGVIQNAGDMLLELLSGLADNGDLAVKEPPSPVVYYDYLHIFLITYSVNSAQIIDLLVSILGLTSVGYYLFLFGLRWSVMKDLLWSVVSRVMSIVSGVCFVALFTLVTVLIDMCVASHMQMRYLSYNWMVIPLYWLPYFIGHTATSHHYEAGNNKISRSIQTLQAMTGTRLYLSVLLFVLSFIPSLSNARYLITINVGLSSVASFVSMNLVRKGKLSGLQHFLLEVFLSIPLTLFTLTLSTHLVVLLAPIMGRSGNDSPDITIGGVNAFLAVFVGFGLSGIELLCNTRSVRRALCVLLLVAAVAMITPVEVYKGNVLQRHYWFHTQVTTYNASFAPTEVNSGILITNVDPYTVGSALAAIKESPYYVNEGNKLTGFIKDSDIKYINKECDAIYCNLPCFRPRFDKIMKKSLFINMEPPKEFSRSLRLVNKECDGKSCVVSFIMKGPEFNTITLYSHFNITGWSFEPDVKPTTVFKNKPVYLITHAYDTYVEFFKPLQFNITIEVPSSRQSERLVEISHHAHKTYDPENFTKKYKNLLDHMPEYFNIATFLSFRDNYVF